MKENDVFKLSWKDEYKKTQSPHTDWHHCFEGLGIVKVDRGGKLYIHDNFWGAGSGGKVFYADDIEKKLNIRLLGNLDDYNKITEYNSRFYNSKDILHITRQHACSTNCIEYFVKKDAEFCTETILRKLKDKIINNEHDIKYKKRENERLIEQVEKVLNGDTSEVWL